MDLTFVQTSNMFGRDGAWETEFSVDQEFNLHLERESSGKIIMMQKTAGTFFDIVKDFDMKSGDVVYDYDSASFLGTKTIKIVSESAIRFASLTTSGEVTEIKSQSKEIEVTSNGTTEVTPDAGFSYLNSVKVKTNVAQSGGGWGSDWHYYDYAVVENMIGDLPTALIDYMQIAKENNAIIIPWRIVDTPQAFAVDFNIKISVEVFIPEENTVERRLGTILEALQEIEKWAKGYNLHDIPEITEEEFYNLNA